MSKERIQVRKPNNGIFREYQPDPKQCTITGMNSKKCHAYNHGDCMNAFVCEIKNKEDV